MPRSCLLHALLLSLLLLLGTVPSFSRGAAVSRRAKKKKGSMKGGMRSKKKGGMMMKKSSKGMMGMMMMKKPAKKPTLGVGEPGSWQELAEYPIAAYGHVLGAVSDIFLVGTTGATEFPDGRTYAYDISTNQWTRRADAPQPLYLAAGVGFDGVLYVTGGVVQSTNQVSNAVYSFDLSTNAWTTLPSMKTARVNHASAFIGGEVYVFGGCQASNGVCTVSNSLSSCEKYSISSNSWSNCSNLPAGRSGAGAAAEASDNLIYIVGGLASGTGLDGAVLAYDQATDSYETISSSSQAATMPTPRYLFSGVGAVGSNVYAVGGLDAPYNGNLQTLSPSAVVEVYDVDTQTWTTGPSLSAPVAVAAVAATAAGVYITGGLEEGGAISQTAQVLLS